MAVQTTVIKADVKELVTRPLHFIHVTAPPPRWLRHRRYNPGPIEMNLNTHLMFDVSRQD